ncbi:MAG: thiamine-phosphate kinase, partial [Verrucomicrobiota bacterium]|nr:thiamine-phosphate kinase [Verrucomicrobiota bacterium]
MNLREVGENRLLEKILPHLPRTRAVVNGAGDDCALVEFGRANELLVLKTDAVVEGVHFRRDAKPGEVGWKAMARPLSDFAAVSARPQFALITILAPAKTTERWITNLYRGLTRAAETFEVAIVGGETSATRGPIAISVSLAGAVERDRFVSRSGGRAGDDLYVTGTLGGSIRGKHLRFVPRLEESRWLTSHFSIHAMMDLSDGLGADLPRLARASGVAFEIEEAALPLTRGCTAAQAISDGEDYELLFAIAPNESKKLPARWQKKFPKLRLTRIGRLVPRSASRAPS